MGPMGDEEPMGGGPSQACRPIRRAADSQTATTWIKDVWSPFVAEAHPREFTLLVTDNLASSASSQWDEELAKVR